MIPVDGTTGRVLLAPPVRDRKVGENYAKLMAWRTRAQPAGARDADTPQSRSGPASWREGIGLCRTEHMFFEGDRITAMREMIVAHDVAGRRQALAKLLPMQRHDFEAMFDAMSGYPVTIRLLDPPLHEFLPHSTLSRRARQVAQDLRGRPCSAGIELARRGEPDAGAPWLPAWDRLSRNRRDASRAIFEAACHAVARGAA